MIPIIVFQRLYCVSCFGKNDCDGNLLEISFSSPSSPDTFLGSWWYLPIKPCERGNRSGRCCRSPGFQFCLPNWSDCKHRILNFDSTLMSLSKIYSRLWIENIVIVLGWWWELWKKPSFLTIKSVYSFDCQSNIFVHKKTNFFTIICFMELNWLLNFVYYQSGLILWN